MREYIAVSACLLGINTKYSGGNNYNEKIKELIKGKTVIVICPEVFSNLPIPRTPSEILSDFKVKQKNGNDVTKEFELGKNRTLEFLKRYNCKTVILKNGSPSCGEFTYDGTFTSTKIKREGITAKALKDRGYNLIYID